MKARVDKSTILPDVTIIKPSVFNDCRGNIYTSWSDVDYEKLLPLRFVRDKFAESDYNALRGLHGDAKTWKLVSCVYGEIYEVVVDMRPESPTYKKWDLFILNNTNCTQILIPPRFVNGYYVRSQKAVFHYKLAYDGGYIDAKEQITVKWDDPDLNITWGDIKPILQERDK